MQDTGSVAAIILAAGKSARFGADKLLFEFNHAGVRQPLILHTLLPWFAVFDELSVVIAENKILLHETILNFAELHHKKISVIECKSAELGMGHSLKAAIEVQQEAKGWVVGLADMPFIPVKVLKQISQNIKLGADITAPYCDDQRGHPVGLNYRYKDELMALKGDSGAKKILLRDAEKIQKINIEHHGILVDIDYVEDLAVIEKFN